MIDQSSINRVSDCSATCMICCVSSGRELIFWVDRKLPVWAIQVRQLTLTNMETISFNDNKKVFNYSS